MSFGRAVVLLIGILSCSYALTVIGYVQFIPDLGLKTFFSEDLKGLRDSASPIDGNALPQFGDTIKEIAGNPVRTWPDILNAPRNIRLTIDASDAGLKDLVNRGMIKQENDETYVRVRFARNNNGTGNQFEAWCRLGRLPYRDLTPAILWFFLKMALVGVGVLVFLKRPKDPAATQFFVLCIVTLGAYIGAYHWDHISNRPPLVVFFIFWAVFLPAVTLHFYLVFPRQKSSLQHKWLTLALIYGLPTLFLFVFLYLYFQARAIYEVYRLAAQQGSIADKGLTQLAGNVKEALDQLKQMALTYLCVATVYYLGSIAALIHSYWTAKDATQKNQVKCIVLGAVLALLPIGYSLHIVLFDPEAFGRGETTWYMFLASLCLTVAFVISITQYRLMELDQLISSSGLYFLISCLIGLGYYGVVFLGTLVFNQVFASPQLSEAIRVSTIALILMWVMDIARGRFKKALDRRFHREKYHLDRTLHRMSEAVQQLVDPPTLVQRLLHASTDLLGVERGAVYLPQGNAAIFRLAGWVGPAPTQMELSKSGPLLQALTEQPVIATFQSNDTPAALEQLRDCQGELAHALIQDGRLLAILILGGKENAPYRNEDLDLLAAFSQITVVALGSAEGHQIIEDLNKELHVKVEKIAEQQRRILALQGQLRRNNSSAENNEKINQDFAAKSNELSSKSRDHSEMTDFDVVTKPRNIVGNSPKLRETLMMIQKVAVTDAVVLLRGESGTGKELMAHAIHDQSSRAKKSLVTVHCAALSPNILESELFGHVKGAFTGAHKDKVGRFELANEGTLFLDEIGDISLETQTKLLRVLQEQTFERVGSSESIQVDVRIIAATHQDLELLIRKGKFREDLFYRLNVFPVTLPPLRDRREDIIELARYFLKRSASKSGKWPLDFDDAATRQLTEYDWPGNIRQLENVIERAVVLAEGDTVRLIDLPTELIEVDSYQSSESHLAFADGDSLDDSDFVLPKTVESQSVSRNRRPGQYQRQDMALEKILTALNQADGNKAEAARVLGVARSTLVSRLKKYGL